MHQYVYNSLVESMNDMFTEYESTPKRQVLNAPVNTKYNNKYAQWQKVMDEWLYTVVTCFK